MLCHPRRQVHTAGDSLAVAEPHLYQPTMIYDFPAAISPLSKNKKDEPEWVERFNGEKRTEKYADQDWKNAAGQVMGRSTAPGPRADENFYYGIGMTPFGAD